MTDTPFRPLVVHPNARRGRRVPPDDIRWPVWVPFVTAVVPLVVAVDVLNNRGALWPPTLITGLMVAIVCPWIADAVLETVGVVRGRPVLFGPPAWLFSAVVVGGSAILLFTPHAPGSFVELTPFFLVVLTAEMGARLQRLGGAVVAVASAAVLVAADVFGAYEYVFVWVIGVAFAWIGGALIGYSARLAVSLKRAEADLQKKAADDERSRIAREVHDVIAHSLSVTMLHVTAARMALERGSDRAPEALESLQEAERQGRKSLADIRSTVGLLGPDGSQAEPPLPGAVDLPKLVTDFRNAGLDVTLWMDGDVQALEPGTGLNLYRIVQESLTNASKHAPGAKAHVELDVGDDDIRLRVHNGPGNGAKTTAGSGLGLPGMAERAGMLGGTLAAHADDTGWTVLLVAPRRAPAEQA